MLLDDIFSPRTAKRGLIETPRQTTVYHIGDAADYSGRFIAKGPYYVLTAASDPAFPGGVFSGSVNLDVAHYAAETISFDNATGKILDSANLLATVLTGDTLICKGTAGNDNIAFVVTTGAQAGYAIVTPAPTTEGAGAYISLYKRASHANAAVVDAAAGLMWSRNTSTGEKVGPASNGTLVWYDATLNRILHPAAADLSIVAPSTLKIIGGAGEIARYHVGDVLVLSGFVAASNNLPGWVVSSVAVNGLDLDIVLRVLGATSPAAAAAAGSRSISLITRSIFNYAAAANAISLSGFTDWRVPTDAELVSLRDMEPTTGVPDITAFPAWPAVVVLSSGITPSDTTNIQRINFNTASVSGQVKTTANVVALVRSI